MIRNFIGKDTAIDKNGFRLRGSGEVSRLEGLTDAVFGFAITLLVVSLEVPSSFDDLAYTMQGFAAFAVTLAAIVGIWYAHYLFFRRYGYQDGIILVLNFVLIFVVLFYIYPLKFLANILVNYGIMHSLFGFEFRGDISIQNYQMSHLMQIYSFGFLSVFFVLFLFYFRVYKKRVQIELNDLEIMITKMSMESHLIAAVIAVLSILLSSIGYNAASGWIYFLVGPLAGFNGYRRAKQIERLQDKKGK